MKHGIQSKIAQKTDVTPSFISQILSGHKRPSWNKAKALARATDTEPVLWLEGSPEEIRDALKKQ